MRFVANVIWKNFLIIMRSKVFTASIKATRSTSTLFTTGSVTALSKAATTALTALCAVMATMVITMSRSVLKLGEKQKSLKNKTLQWVKNCFEMLKCIVQSVEKSFSLSQHCKREMVRSWKFWTRNWLVHAPMTYHELKKKMIKHLLGRTQWQIRSTTVLDVFSCFSWTTLKRTPERFFDVWKQSFARRMDGNHDSSIFLVTQLILMTLVTCGMSFFWIPGHWAPDIVGECFS